MSKYTNEEIILALQNDKELELLLAEMRVYANRDINVNEAASLLKWKREYTFSFELIEYLFEYCASNRAMHIANMNAVAKNWHSEGFRTREEAEAFTIGYTDNRNDAKTSSSESAIIDEYNKLTKADKKLVNSIIKRLAEGQ